MTLTVIGKLDYEGDEARIEGDSVSSRKMIAKVVSFLTIKDNKLGGSLKGKNVVAQIVDEGKYAGWIERVEELPLEDKMKKAGFGQPTPGSAPSTEPAKSAPGKEGGPGLKAVEGQIVSIDKPAHKITLKDRAGESHTFVWGPGLDADFQKLEQWWFCKVTGEYLPDVEIWKAISQGFFKRPDDWPKSGGSGGGKYSQPRNERLIAFLALHRDSVQLFQSTTTPDSLDFEAAEDVIYDRAKKTLERAMKDFGGA
jgi:hypothetical protein